LDNVACITGWREAWFAEELALSWFPDRVRDMKDTLSNAFCFKSCLLYLPFILTWTYRRDYQVCV